VDACVFFEQLKEFEHGSESLGRIINLIWIDTLLSGEHKPAIRACLEAKRYVLPTNFNPPSWETLAAISVTMCLLQLASTSAPRLDL